MSTLINYAHGSHKQAQERNTKSGFEHGFDKVIQYGQNSLDPNFRKEYACILVFEKGAGYWLWKPWIILDALKKAKDDDIIFYCDSGAEFISDITPLIELCKLQDRVLFHTDPVPGNTEAQQTKRDAFIIMNCEEERFINALPVHAGFQIYKRTEENIKFMEEYLNMCKIYHLISDAENVMGKPNYPGFVAHRHDQSVLSLLRTKWGFKTFRDPTQYGNPYITDAEKYEQIINHTRNIN